MDRDSANVLTRVVVGTLLVSFTAQQPQGGLAAKLKMDHGEGIVAIMEGSALAEFKVRITFLSKPQLQTQLNRTSTQPNLNFGFGLTRLSLYTKTRDLTRKDYPCPWGLKCFT